MILSEVIRVLAAGTAVVRWRACAAVPEGWASVLDGAERERAGRFHFEADRASYVSAHVLVRQMLAAYGGLAAGAWRFVAGPFGKPAVDPALGRDWLRFNVSHTRGMAAVVVMRDGDVGVDVEGLDRRHDGGAIAARFFGPEEVRLLEAGQPETFLRLWTLKESVMKATGEGFGLALDAFAVTLDPPGVRFVAGERGAWSFAQEVAGRHVVAAAARVPGVAFDMAAG